MAIPNKTTEIYKRIRPLTSIIQKGTIIAIDPSIGSSSSMPGWAVYHLSELIDSGVLDIDSSLSVYERAQDIHRKLHQLYKYYKPDVLIYEEIPDQAYMPPASTRVNHRPSFATGNNAKAHSTLLKALGVVLGVPGPDQYYVR